MDKTVANLNIEHYRRLLAETTDDAKRQTLLRLLAEEEARLAAIMLSNYPSAIVHLACERCGMRDACRLYRLIQEHEPTTPIGSVLAKLAANCPQQTNLDDCGLRYVEVPAVRPMAATG